MAMASFQGMGSLGYESFGTGDFSRDSSRLQPLMLDKTVDSYLKQMAGKFKKSDDIFMDQSEHHQKPYSVKSSPATTTRPPIVWFPSDPDCGDDQVGDGFMNTFQLIAFLLSIFNIAAIMVSNANSNNRNNNNNDNQFNGNNNNNNEGNANSEVMAMNMVMLGGRDFEGSKHRTKRSSENLESCPKESNDVKVEAAVVVQRLSQLWIQSHLAASRDCLRRLMCEANDELSRRSTVGWVMVETGSDAIITYLPSKITGSLLERRELQDAAHYGRLGLNCSQVFAGCNPAEWRFISVSSSFTWSQFGELKMIEKLLKWAYNKS